MVLKELISLWHDDSAIASILKEFDDMLVHSKEMFELTTSYLTQNESDINFRKRLADMDIQLNKMQRNIRREIVTHLSVQGTADVVPCLQLMSITKDAERIGDYCKNIYEIISANTEVRNDQLIPDLMGMRVKLLTWFDQTKRAFDRADKELAKSTRQEAYFHEKECDRLVISLSKDNGGRNAVSIAMLIRFLKRIAAHLGNICTSVTMPIDKLDYFVKPDGSIGADED